MADKVFQLKWYCNTGVCPFGAHVRQRCGLWLNPLSSTKTMMRPVFGLFFNLRPALLLPSPDGLLVPLQSSSHRTLATPTQLPQNAPGLRGMVAHPAFLLDQVHHPPRRPQAGFIAQSLWPAFQSALDLRQVPWTQSRLAAGASGFPQPGQSRRLQLLRPATYRLPMRPEPPRNLGLMNSFSQQPRRPQAPLLQCRKVSPHSCWVSHEPTLSQKPGNVTILFNIQ